MSKIIENIIGGLVAFVAIIVTFAFVLLLITSPFWFILFAIKLLR